MKLEDLPEMKNGDIIKLKIQEPWAPKPKSTVAYFQDKETINGEDIIHVARYYEGDSPIGIESFYLQNIKELELASNGYQKIRNWGIPK